MHTEQTLATDGRVLHRPFAYDLLLKVVWFGKERAFREKVLQLARLQPGESMLDVGCGTGTLAIAAARQAGPKVSVTGIDASQEMLSRARKKAKDAGVTATFRNALAEVLPFPDAHFDLVTATTMLHHLPQKTRRACAREIRRVLKPGGRVVAVDFDGSTEHGLIAHFHRHSYVNVDELLGLLSEAGLRPVKSGPIGLSNLQFVVAERPTNERER